MTHSLPPAEKLHKQVTWCGMCPRSTTDPLEYGIIRLPPPDSEEPPIPFYFCPECFQQALKDVQGNGAVQIVQFPKKIAPKVKATAGQTIPIPREAGVESGSNPSQGGDVSITRVKPVGSGQGKAKKGGLFG